MSEAISSLLPDAMQNPQAKNNEMEQKYQSTLPQEFNPESMVGQKKQQDNDFTCDFKIIVKEKYQEKLKCDATQQMFTIIINQIIEERVKRNFVATPDQKSEPGFEVTVEMHEKIQQLQTRQRGMSEQEKKKAKEEQVKRRVQQLMKKRPSKKVIPAYEQDPNRDQGFILAQKMNEAKQQRERRYIQSKKELEEQKKAALENQLSTKSCVDNTSIHSGSKSHRKFRKKSDDLQLPKINLQNNNFLININRLKTSQSRSKTQREISQGKKFQTMSTIGNDKGALSARSRYLPKREKRRNIPRQIEVLKKSQIITEKYHNKRMTFDLVIDIIFNAVKIVEKKREFFHNQLPIPVHQMIKIYKDKNEKNSNISSWKSQKFRINIHHSKQVKRVGEKKEESENRSFIYDEIEGNTSRLIKTQNEQFQQNGSGLSKSIDEQIEENVSRSRVSKSINEEIEGNTSRVSQRSHYFDICLRNGRDQQSNEQLEKESQQNEEVKQRKLTTPQIEDNESQEKENDDKESDQKEDDEKDDDDEKPNQESESMKQEQ